MGCTQSVPVVLDFAEEYEIGDELGQGAFANVKLCVNRKTKLKCAVKIIDRSNLKPHDEMCFKREVDIMKTLSHPNIVKSFNFYNEKSFYYLVIEYMEGGELFDRIVKKVTYTEKEARDVIKVLVGAIKHCHDHNIVHRDLKPENLLLTSRHDDANLKIADFGLAKVQEKDKMLATLCGSPAYIAPEIISKTPYGKPVDMWSIGIIAFVLLGGYLPFPDDGNVSDLFARIHSGKFEFHPQFWSKVSSEAKDLISALIVVNSNQRLSADEVLRHPWICQSDDVLAAINLDSNLTELKRFNEFKKMQGNQDNHLNHHGYHDLMVMFLMLSSPQRCQDVFSLLDCHPEVCQELDQLGRLPLHVAIEFKNPSSIILSILAANPSATKVKDKQNRLPLYMALESKISEEVIIALIAAYPEACKSSVSTMSVATVPPPTVSNTVATTSTTSTFTATFSSAASFSKLLGRESVPSNNQTNYLSLFHMALESQCTIDLISAWLSYHPSAASERNHLGSLPLHTALQTNLSAAILTLLLNSHPQAACEADQAGRLPLSLAFERNVSNEVIILLLTIYPDACKVRNNEVGLPLHVALKSKASTEILLAVISIYIDACKEEDNEGNIPIQLATTHNASTEVVRAISLALSIDLVNS